MNAAAVLLFFSSAVWSSASGRCSAFVDSIRSVHAHGREVINMSHRLHSENTKQRLFISMLIIILSILFISVPVTLKSYRSYQQSDVVLTEISVLRHVADLANEISRERGPANKVMSSTPDELSANLKELTLFRERVDLQIEHTMQRLCCINM